MSVQSNAAEAEAYEESLQAVRGGSLLCGCSGQPPEPRARKLLVIGDSISAGHGVLCNESDSGFSPAQESAYHAYAGMTARALGADIHLVAYSGKGVHAKPDDAALRIELAAAQHV